MPGVRAGLLSEIVVMSIGTLRASKMRSALTVLGVVIGITSIVGMTSLTRGLDQSLRDSMSQLGPNTVIVQKWGALSIIGGGKSFLDVARRPNLTMEDARAIERDCPSVALVDVWLGAFGNAQSRIYYGHEKTRRVSGTWTTEDLGGRHISPPQAGPPLLPSEAEAKAAVVMLLTSPS